MSQLRSDPKEVARMIETLFEPDAVVEMRIPKTQREGTVSGYFTDHEALAKTLVARNGDTAVYVTLNPVKRDLLARASNRIKARVRETTSDRDIERRRWLLIDCDPDRPAGISSTDAQHELALAKAREISADLREQGWPAPVLPDSGNGAHLLYLIDLANDDAAAKLIEAVLKALAAKYDDNDVKIDQTVFNAARIVKAYGTVARKGDNTPDHPHRLSRILEIPQHREIVSRELLEEMAKPFLKRPPRGSGASRTQPFDMEGFIARQKLAARPAAPYQGGRKWQLEECPFNPEHKAPDAVLFESAAGHPNFHCSHNSCKGRNWKELLAKLGVTQPNAPVIEVLDCGQVLAAEAPPQAPLFEGYPLPGYGATLIVGFPKSGKTIFAAQEAIAIASGKSLFEYYRVLRSGPVMMIEQDDRGGVASLKDILIRCGATAALPFHVVPRLPFGFGPAMLEWLEGQILTRRLVLVVLDSYTALRSARGPGADVVKVEQAELEQLDGLGKRLECAIQIIHHGSKGAAGLDWTLNAAGSFVMAGATEAQINVSRFEDLGMGSTERLVRLRGRHGNDIALVLRFREPTLDYEIVFENAAAEHYSIIKQIQSELGATAIFGPKELADATGHHRATAHRLINRLRASGAITKMDHGHYQFAPGMRFL